MDIRTKFMGFDIKSPIVIGSCGLTANIEDLKKAQVAGAGAIILKSLFEEQISQEMNVNIRVYSSSFSGYPEAYNYIQQHTKAHIVDNYLALISKAKEELDIPVIASINCISASEWVSFAQQVEKAGADGIELNMFVLPSDVNLTEEDIERFFEDTIQTIRRATDLPISLKISSYFTALTRTAQKISWLGIKNLNIFNRFYQSDIDINTLQTKPAGVCSTPAELYNTLRWTAILSEAIRCNLTAGGGVHAPEDVVKLLLCGADTVQVVSAVYEQGFDFIKKSNDFLLSWMKEKNYRSLADFKGNMQVKGKDASVFHRVQFMKYFSGVE